MLVIVSVVAVQPFIYRGADITPLQAVEMEAIDAAVHARAGLVSLLHGRTAYQTREMVASYLSQPILPVLSTEPVKRRRGRPRKVR
jgi:hypothetical protein